MNATHRQAVREGPHSNSVGSLLHNTVAYVTNHSREHPSQVCPRPGAQSLAQEARLFSQGVGYVYVLGFIFNFFR